LQFFILKVKNVVKNAVVRCFTFLPLNDVMFKSVKSNLKARSKRSSPQVIATSAVFYGFMDMSRDQWMTGGIDCAPV